MPAPRKTIEKYGLTWAANSDPLKLEFFMIQKGGKFIQNSKECGLGLFHHYREAQKLLWPSDHHHRWSDLILKTVLEERITLCLGPKDSGKTFCAARFALTDYFCFPNETLILISSTDLRGLELRVWGAIKDLFSRARERHEWLPGHPLESKHGIFTDEVGDEVKTRDVRRGLVCIPCVGSQGEWMGGLEKFVGVKQKRRRVIGDECFPAGTMIDTPQGARPIESLNIGDVVNSASGPNRIVGTSERAATWLVRISARDGREIVCTPEHPFFTQFGWVKACELGAWHYMLSPYEAMRILREAIPASSQVESVPSVQAGKDKSNLSMVRESIPENAPQFDRAILQSELLNEMESETARMERGVLHRGKGQEDYSGEVKVALRQPGTLQGNSAQDARPYASTGVGTEATVVHNTEGDWAQAESPWRKRHWTNQSGAAIDGLVPCRNQQSRHQNRETERQRISACLQSGFGIPEIKTGSGGGWPRPHQTDQEGSGREKDGAIAGSWVDRVEIYKSSNFGKRRDDQDGIAVYNLQVEGHPSYSVNGLLVHNCQFMRSSYVTSLEHLDKNDFKFIGLANPIGQGDPADKMAEPIGGWGTEPDSEKTEMWKNRWGGTTINFDGRDSPNFDEPKNQFTYLLNEDDIARTEKRCGRDSVEFWSQIVGKRKAGLNAHRVLTRQMCLNFGAFEPVIWAGSATTKVYGIDASYGGDRCVAGSAEFGLDVRGRSIISFNPPKIIPIMVNSKEEPEDQIARFVKQDCEDQGIPPGNVFFDSTGRGSLGTSFGRIWNTAVNPVEFGGTPTERPVAQSMFIFDEKTGARRLKKCSEHYSKRVTEYWFSVRYVVESKQARNFPEEAAEEFGMREWYMVKGDKRELETKEETKLRMGCSPDFADQASIVVEGARRLGFTIDGLVDEASEIEDDSWLRREMEKHRAQMRKRELSYR